MYHYLCHKIVVYLNKKINFLWNHLISIHIINSLFDVPRVSEKPICYIAHPSLDKDSKPLIMYAKKLVF